MIRFHIVIFCCYLAINQVLGQCGQPGRPHGTNFTNFDAKVHKIHANNSYVTYKCGSERDILHITGLLPLGPEINRTCTDGQWSPVPKCAAQSRKHGPGFLVEYYDWIYPNETSFYPAVSYMEDKPTSKRSFGTFDCQDIKYNFSKTGRLEFKFPKQEVTFFDLIMSSEAFDNDTIDEPAMIDVLNYGIDNDEPSAAAIYTRLESGRDCRAVSVEQVTPTAITRLFPLTKVPSKHEQCTGAILGKMVKVRFYCDLGKEESESTGVVSFEMFTGTMVKVHGLRLYSVPEVCGHPDAPPYAKANVITSNQSESMTYQCAPGFQLLGDNKYTCDKVGRKWAGCPIHCVPSSGLTARCPVDFKDVRAIPEWIINESWLRIDHHNPMSRDVRSGTVIKFKCEPEKEFINSVFDYMLCQADGQWSSRKPTCVDRGKTCPMEAVNQAKPFMTHSVTDPRDSTNTENVYMNTVVKFSCVSGYKLEGADTNFCRYEGWLNELPKCTRI
ncbi:Sushi, von Willebrand factor type A, EGF and pentraxin domain-containing protein 1 [Halotydeus destructor]|nr:Sushi, von Willebrand factor type A, EGF and pentraxin domain-containing protein 1 [Halotydeus destructor]